MDQPKIRTLLTLAGSCGENRTCPSIHELEGEPDTLYVIGKKVSPATRAAFAHLMADDEEIHAVPRRLFPSGRPEV